MQGTEKQFWNLPAGIFHLHLYNVVRENARQEYNMFASANPPWCNVHHQSHSRVCDAERHPVSGVVKHPCIRAPCCRGGSPLYLWYGVRTQSLRNRNIRNGIVRHESKIRWSDCLVFWRDIMCWIYWYAWTHARRDLGSCETVKNDIKYTACPKPFFLRHSALTQMPLLWQMATRIPLT